LLAAALLLAACGGEDGKKSSPGLFEIRPVLGTPSPPCGDGQAKGVVVLPDSGACLELGPPIVDADDVRSATLDEPGRERPTVYIVLGRTGAATLDDFAARSLGKRLAIIVKGRLVNAPTVEAPAFIGRVAVSGLPRVEATDLAEALREARTSR
jgi:preprotein translocase subunit SecD